MSEHYDTLTTNTSETHLAIEDKLPTRRIGRRALLAGLSSGVAAFGVASMARGQEATSSSTETTSTQTTTTTETAPQVTPTLQLGDLVNPKLTPGMELGNNLIQHCQYLNTGRIGRPMMRKETISTRMGSRAVKVRLGLVDIQNHDGIRFISSCEKILTDTTVKVDLVQKATGKRGYKPVKTSPQNARAKLKHPGYKGDDYWKQVSYIGKYTRTGVKDSNMEWTKVSFTLPTPVRSTKQYGIRTRITSKPLFNLDCAELKQKYPQVDQHLCEVNSRNGNYPLKLTTMRRTLPVQWVK